MHGSRNECMNARMNVTRYGHRQVKRTAPSQVSWGCVGGTGDAFDAASSFVFTILTPHSTRHLLLIISHARQIMIYLSTVDSLDPNLPLPMTRCARILYCIQLQPRDRADDVYLHGSHLET